MTMVYVLISYFLEHLFQHFKYILSVEDDTKYALFSGIFTDNVNIKIVKYAHHNYYISVVCLDKLRTYFKSNY